MIVLVIVGAALVFVIGGVLYLLHEVLLENNPNYEYWATKGKIIKVTYGNSSVTFFYMKSTVFGLPFSWSVEKKSDSYDVVKKEMLRQLNGISDKRVLKRQTLK